MVRELPREKTAYWNFTGWSVFNAGNGLEKLGLGEMPNGGLLRNGNREGRS